MDIDGGYKPAEAIGLLAGIAAHIYRKQLMKDVTLREIADHLVEFAKADCRD